jgi:hypothetical protein
MNKVIFSDFTLQNSQLFRWRYMSSIWVQTNSYLWGNNGEQPEVTWPEVTWPEVTWPEVTWPEEDLSGTGSMLCARATGSFAIPLVAFSPEVTSVIVCACATGTFCIATRVVVQVHGYLWPKGWKGVRMPNRKLRNIPLVGPFHRKLATGSDVIFPRIFLSSSTKCWFGGFSTTSASTPFTGYLPGKIS